MLNARSVVPLLHSEVFYDSQRVLITMVGDVEETGCAARLVELLGYSAARGNR
jgi:hypothetical protein